MDTTLRVSIGACSSVSSLACPAVNISSRHRSRTALIGSSLSANRNTPGFSAAHTFGYRFGLVFAAVPWHECEEAEVHQRKQPRQDHGHIGLADRAEEVGGLSPEPAENQEAQNEQRQSGFVVGPFVSDRFDRAAIEPGQHEENEHGTAH